MDFFSSVTVEGSEYLVADEHYFDADGNPAGGKTWGIMTALTGLPLGTGSRRWRWGTIHP